MYVETTNRDSEGQPTTGTLTVTVDEEPHTVEFAETGTAQVSEEVGQFLIDADDYDVRRHEGDDSEADTETATDETGQSDN